MKLPVQVAFQGMEASEAVEMDVQQRAQKLERFCPTIIGCRVSVELLHKHQRHGRPYGVRVDLTLPGRELAVSRVQNEDVYVAVRDAFDDMTRRLEDTVRRNRDQRKAQPAD